MLGTSCGFGALVMRNEMTEVAMNLHDLKQETIDIEEVILAYSQKEIERAMPEIETDDSVVTLAVQEQTGEPIHTVEAGLHHQIDPSYQ